jgi:hypothetical protein
LLSEGFLIDRQCDLFRLGQLGFHRRQKPRQRHLLWEILGTLQTKTSQRLQQSRPSRELPRSRNCSEKRQLITSKGVVITRPRLAAHSMVYDVADIVREMPLLLPNLKQDSEDIYQDLKPTDAPALLVRFLMNGVEMPEWESESIVTKRVPLGELTNSQRVKSIRSMGAHSVASQSARCSVSGRLRCSSKVRGPAFRCGNH